MGNIRSDSIGITGILPEDPDHIPITPPSGLIWMQPCTLWGAFEAFGTTDVRVSLKGKTLDFVITHADALALRSLLDQAIEVMRKDEDEGIPKAKPIRHGEDSK